MFVLSVWFLLLLLLPHAFAHKICTKNVALIYWRRCDYTVHTPGTYQMFIVYRLHQSTYFRQDSVRAYFICHFVVNCASLWCFKNKSSEFDAFDMVLIATGVCWLFGSTFVALCFIVVVQCGGDFTWNNAFFANLVAIVNYLLCARQVRGPSRWDEVSAVRTSRYRSVESVCAILHISVHVYCKSIQTSEVHWFLNK